MGVVENLPCDCAALGTLAAIIGLALNTYSYGTIELASETYTLSCGWNEAVYTVPGNDFNFMYQEYSNLNLTKGEKCEALNAINSQDYFVDVCEPYTFSVGIGMLASGVLGTLIATCSVNSQAPKFAAKKTTMFRVGLFVSGTLYIVGAFMWWYYSKCNGWHDLVRTRVGVGVSWYFIAIGGVFNVIGSMLSFRNPDERIKRAKALRRKRARQSTNYAFAHAATTSLMSGVTGDSALTMSTN